MYKECSECRQSWNDRDHFITDSRVRLTGYRVDFADLGNGRFVFEHLCGAILTLAVDELADLYGGSIYEERRTGTADCPGYCLYENRLDPCPARCECAYVREMLQFLR